MFMREEKRFYSVSQGCFESWHFLNLSWKFKLHLETDKDSFRYLKKKKRKIQLYNTMTCRSTHTNVTESMTTECLPLAELDIML